MPHKARAARNGISHRTIHSIYTRRKEVLAAVDGGSPSFSRCVQPCRFPFVHELLYQCFPRVRCMACKNMPLSRLALFIEARDFAQRHDPWAPFQSSNGFVDLWVRLHLMKSIHLLRTGGGVDLIEGETRMTALREKMVRMDPDCIVNMDEAALFLPTGTHTFICFCERHPGRHAARGFKARKHA